MSADGGRSRPVPPRVRRALAAVAIGGAALALPARPAPAATPPPGADQAREATTAELERETDGAVTIETHAATGLVRFVGTTRDRPIPRSAGVTANGADDAAALGFLADHGEAFGVTDPAAQLQTTSSGDDAVSFQQVHDGIPVLGGELAVTLDGAGNVLSAGGELSPASDVDTKASIDADEAIVVAGDLAEKHHGSRGRILEAPEQWIYDPALLGGPDLGPARLVWRLTVAGEAPTPFRDLVLIDADTGGVALQIEELAHARDREVCDRANVVGAAEACSAPVTRSEGQAAVGIVEVDRAYDYSGDVYDYYATMFGRDSLDDAGMTLRSTVRYCPSASECPYQNAYWNGAQMVYGDGFAGADDVVGHELTHGVTDFESSLFYYYQSGAINESLSDVFGELIDQQNGSGTDTPAVRWLMGEDLPSIGAIRDMEDPPAYGDPDRMGSALYHTASTDSGGVHINSGISNKAAFLMVDGGTFNGRTVTALGADKTARIYYEAATNLLTSAGDYADLYNALQQGCNNLVGTDGIVAADCAEVTDAVEATEMDEPPPAAASATHAPICPPGLVEDDLFFDDLENPASGNWATSKTGTYQTWAYPQTPNIYTGFDATYATSGTTNMFGADINLSSDARIARTADVVPPVDKTTYLHFAHAYGIENGWDGGRVEYSTNGGAAWTDAGSLFTDNGYNGTANTYGGSAFTGDSHGYYSSRLDLSSLAGQNVRFRFRMKTDATVGSYGWFIDDIRVYTCESPATVPDAPTGVSAIAGNQRATVAWTAPSSDGGSPISGYVVTPYIGGTAQSPALFDASSTTRLLPGLANGTEYTFEVAAVNAVGTGPGSSASNAVTPVVTTLADFDGDGGTDVSVFRPSSGGWFVEGAGVTYLGLDGDVPVPADYDGAGTSERAVWRPSTGAWFVEGAAGATYHGLDGDVAVPGDYDGDGTTDLAVWRPSNGGWYVEGAGVTYLGLDGDVPVPADYDGDGTTDLAVFRPSIGAWYVEGEAVQFHGADGDVPLPADYSGDGAADLAVFRPSIGAWYVEGEAATYFGLGSDVPVPGQYDADGETDLAVFRPSNGGWYIDGAASTTYYGLVGDLPAPRSPALG